MQALSKRLAALEARNRDVGPLLLSWRIEPSSLATTSYAGTHYTQAKGESRGDFFARVAEAVPSSAVLWVDELDEAL